MPRPPVGVATNGYRPTEHAVVAELVGDLVRRFESEAARLVEVFARGRGMRSGDVHALTSIRLAELREAPETPGDLSQALLMTTGAVTGLVDRLVTMDHVRREPDRRDRRRVRLRTTGAGAEVADELLAIMAVRTGGVAAGFSIAELRTVHRFLGEVVSATAGHCWTLEGRTVPDPS